MKTLITEGQKKQVKRFAEDAVNRAIADDFLDKDSIQRLIEQGDKFQDHIIAGIREISVSNQFANEEVESSYGYLSGYTKPVSIEDQIDILRAHWPALNPDSAIRYMREVYPSLQFPTWVEGPFALIRPGFFSETYGEELEEVLKALAKSCNGKFCNHRAGRLGPKYLRQSTRTVDMINRIIEQQPNSDILVVSEQFGIRHRGRSVRRAREVSAHAHSEYGEGTKNVGTMILANPIRLQNYDDLWIDCPGDEYSPDAVGGFSRAPYFNFDFGRVGLGTRWVVGPRGSCGSASGFLPLEL